MTHCIVSGPRNSSNKQHSMSSVESPKTHCMVRLCATKTITKLGKSSDETTNGDIHDDCKKNKEDKYADTDNNGKEDNTTTTTMLQR